MSVNIAIAKQERLVALKSALMAENNYNYEVEQRFRDLLLEFRAADARLGHVRVRSQAEGWNGRVG